MSRVERVRADTTLPEHLNDFSSEEGGAFSSVTDPLARPLVVAVAIDSDVTPELLTATGDEFLSEGPAQEIDAALAFAAVEPLRFSPPLLNASPVAPATRYASVEIWRPPRHLPAAGIAVSACTLLALLLVVDAPGWIRSTSDRPPVPSMPASEPPAIALPQPAPLAPLPAGVAAQAPRPIGSVPSERATSRHAAPAQSPRLPAETRVARGLSPLKATPLASREVIVEPPPSPQVLPVEPRAPVNAAPPIAAPPLDVPTAVRPSIAAAPRSETTRPEATRPEAASSSDANLIGGVLNRYRGAFSVLDATAARTVWPSVDHRALERAFAQLDEQEIAFDACQIDIDGVRAAAKCRGRARYVAKVGSRSPHTAERQWDFRLQKVDDRWIIEGVATR